VVFTTLRSQARPLRFAIVGVIGFLTDAGSVFALTQAGLDPFSARVISIALAMFTTWRLNRAMTFGDSGRSEVSEGARYGVVALAVAGLNYVIYAGLLLAFGQLWPVAATAIASVVAMAASYFGYSRLVFSRN
jgi:putative flippase GtrA